MFKLLKEKYKLFIKSLYEEFIDDEISSWIHDYWNDLYDRYIGDSSDKD